MSHNLHEISANYIESMISNVKDMKAIIFDNETQVIFSLEFSKSLALKQEIFLFENIDKIQSDQKLNLNGIFFIRPTQQNLEYLKNILKSSNFKEINLFFTNQLTDDYLKKLAENDINTQVKNVQEIYLDYYIINSNIFHLNIESCICNLDMTPMEKWNQYDTQMYERIYQGLISACLSNRMKPLIKSVKGSFLCQKLGKKLAAFFEDNYEFIRKECGQHFNGILLLYDRKEDPISPLINQWTYQAQLHEILGIKNNVIELKKGNDNAKPEKFVISDVEAIDKFYSKYKLADYGTVATAVQQEADKLKNENDLLNKESSIEELRKIIDQLPEKKKESMAITKHYKLFYSISEYVTKHKLMELSKLEQDISVNDNRKEQFNQIVQIISDPKVQHLDKCKLYLLYMLKYENDSSVNNLKNKMIENDLGDWVKYGDALIKYAGKQRRNLDCFQDKDIFSKGKKFIMNAFGQGNENAFMQHISYLNGIVERMLKGKSKDNETININNNSGMNEPKVNNLIIFVFGGITFEETRDLTLLGNQLGVNIICGGTNVVNSKSFLAEMSMIKEKMSSGNDQAIIVG
jgi:vacuolar protein sorting-associated protein 45